MVQGIRYTPSCLDNQTLQMTGVVEREINGTPSGTFGYTYNETCEYGCVNDTVTSQCAPAPFNATLNIGIPVIVVFIVLLVWLLRKN